MSQDGSYNFHTHLRPKATDVVVVISIVMLHYANVGLCSSVCDKGIILREDMAHVGVVVPVGDTVMIDEAQRPFRSWVTYTRYFISYPPLDMESLPCSTYRLAATC